MKFVTCIVCILCLYSCWNNSEPKITEIQVDRPVQNELIKKFEKQRQFLYGRSIPSLSIVLSNKLSVGKCILLLYSETDCDNCVEKGFAIIRKLDSLKVSNTFVITSTPNPGRHQLLYDYTKYVYVDNQDLIRKDLKYVTTPVLLVLNKDKQIQRVLFSGIASEEEENEFLLYCSIPSK